MARSLLNFFDILFTHRYEPLLWKYNRDSGDAGSRCVANGRSYTGDSKFRFAELDRNTREKGFSRLGRQGLGVGNGPTAGGILCAGGKYFEPLRRRQVTDQQPAGRRPVQGHARPDARADAKMP